MSTVAQILAVEQSQVGYVETPNNLTKYNDAFYGRRVAAQWCATFQWWCLKNQGIDIGHYDNCQTWWNALTDRHVTDPQPGDLVFFDWDRNHVSDHIGMVTAVSTTRLMTIEGNTSLAIQSNGGAVMTRTRNRDNTIVGYARPPYQASENVKQIDACKIPGMADGRWVLTDDGGVRALPVSRAPFFGSYPGLPEKDRQGSRSFIAIQANDPNSAAAGYTIFGDDDTQYSFPI